MAGSRHGPRSIASIVVAVLLAIGSPEALAQSRAEQLLWKGELDAALVVAREDADARPDALDAQELLIDMYLSAGRPSLAMQRQQQRVEANPTDPDAHYLLGRALVVPDEARRAYESALRMQPDHARAHMGIAALHAAEGQHAEARDGYARAVQGDASLSEAWLGLVRSHLALGDPAAAEKAAREGTRAVPAEGGLWLALASLVPAEAEAILRDGASKSAADPRVHERLAGILLQRGEAKAAVESARKALEKDPRRLEAARHLVMAEALVSGALDFAAFQKLVHARSIQDADPGAAGTTFDELVKRHRKTALTWMARAQFRQARGDVEGALSDLSRAVELAPDDSEAQAAYGLLLLEAERPDEARLWLRRAARSRPWDRSLAIALARAHGQAGDPAASAMELAALHRRLPWDVEVALLLADAHVTAGEAERAWLVLGEMLRRLPDPRLAAALVMVAPQAGRHLEAARLLDQLAERSDSSRLRELADRLRAMPGGG